MYPYNDFPRCHLASMRPRIGPGKITNCFASVSGASRGRRRRIVRNSRCIPGNRRRSTTSVKSRPESGWNAPPPHFLPLVMARYIDRISGIVAHLRFRRFRFIRRFNDAKRDTRALSICSIYSARSFEWKKQRNVEKCGFLMIQKYCSRTSKMAMWKSCGFIVKKSQGETNFTHR